MSSAENQYGDVETEQQRLARDSEVIMLCLIPYPLPDPQSN